MPNVTVYAERSTPYLRNLDIWVIEEPSYTGGPRHILYFNSDQEPDEFGMPAMLVHAVPITEGVGPMRPSLTLDMRWVEPLLNALLDQAPVTADKQILSMLSKETERVDKMLDHMLSARPGVLNTIFGAGGSGGGAGGVQPGGS